jgi:hypothetical protein
LLQWASIEAAFMGCVSRERRVKQRAHESGHYTIANNKVVKPTIFNRG